MKRCQILCLGISTIILARVGTTGLHRLYQGLDIWDCARILTILSMTTTTLQSDRLRYNIPHDGWRDSANHAKSNEP